MKTLTQFAMCLTLMLGVLSQQSLAQGYSVGDAPSLGDLQVSAISPGGTTTGTNVGVGSFVTVYVDTGSWSDSDIQTGSTQTPVADSMGQVTWSIDTPEIVLFPSTGTSFSFQAPPSLDGSTITVTATIYDSRTKGNDDAISRSLTLKILSVKILEVVNDGYFGPPPATRFVGSTVNLRAMPDPAGAVFSTPPQWRFTAVPTGSLYEMYQSASSVYTTGETASFAPDVSRSYTVSATSGNTKSITINVKTVGILRIDDSADTSAISPFEKNILRPVQLKIIADPEYFSFPSMQPSWTVTFTDPDSGPTQVASGNGPFVEFTPQNEGDYEVIAQVAGNDIQGNAVAQAQVKAVDGWTADNSPNPLTLTFISPKDGAKITKGDTVTLMMRVFDKDTLTRNADNSSRTLPYLDTIQGQKVVVPPRGNIKAELSGDNVTFPSGATVNLAWVPALNLWQQSIEVKISQQWTGNSAKVTVTFTDKQEVPAGYKITAGSIIDDPLEATLSWTEATVIPTTMDGNKQFHLNGNVSVESPLFSLQTTSMTKIICKFGPEDGSDYSGYVVHESFDPEKCDAAASLFNDNVVVLAKRPLKGTDPTDGTDIIAGLVAAKLWTIGNGSFTIESTIDTPPLYVIADYYTFGQKAQVLANNLKPESAATIISVSQKQSYSVGNYTRTLDATAKSNLPAQQTQQVH